MATAPSFEGLSAVSPTSVVELSVSCRNLKDMDVFSKSDPMCVLYLKEFGQNKWMEFDRTETIQNTLNPDFVKKFVMTYRFEESQHLRFDLYDVDSASPNLENHDFLGSMECTLAEIIATVTLERPIVLNNKHSGRIAVYAEELAGCKEEVSLHFLGRKLDRKDFFGKSDPFLLFSKANENSTYTVVHRTEFIKRTLNPNWKPFALSVQSLCNGDNDRTLKVQCFDWNLNGNHKLIGEFYTNLSELKRGPCKSTMFELINPKKQRKKRNYKNSGVVEMLAISIQEVPSFLDYLLGGTELLCTIAIDFTSSNGDPRSPSSLHYMDPVHPNQYARALRAVGEIIQDYDSDKMFPVLGFGARIPPDGRVSHEFFVNLHPSNPFCAGIEGVMEAYHQCLFKIQLYGPTNFAPVINHVARFASAHQDGSKYHILLILTDGIITDLPQTKQAIVMAASLPLSIIIVGVGNADFTAMDELDGDVVRLSYKGQYAERDIVQFVPFRDFEKGLSSEDYLFSQACLARTVLAEIPEQFLSYMKKKAIKPKPPVKLQYPLPPDPERRDEPPT